MSRDLTIYGNRKFISSITALSLNTSLSPMSANSLNWKILNTNGELTTQAEKAALRCEWKGPGCHLYIWAHNKETTHLQVEMDVLSMSYTSPEDESGLACIIFKVCLNRHANWANNHNNTWRGDIGVIFDSVNDPWDPEVYGDLIESLTSCFLGENEIFEDSAEDIMAKWRKIGEPVPLLQGSVLPFQDLSYSSLERLAPERWFNDDLVNTGIRNWCIDTLLRTHPGHPPVVSTTDKFYAKLCGPGGGLEAVATWFKNIDIAQQEYVVFPVNWKGNHWILAIIIHPARALVPDGEPVLFAIFDSMRSKQAAQTISDELSTWLYHRLGIPEVEKHILLIQAKVPQQRDDYSCGVYVIHFAKVFFSNAEQYTAHIQNKLTNNQVQSLWQAGNIPSVREGLRTFIQETAIL